MITTKKILENIKEIRLKKGISQEYIAEKIELKQGSYNLIENGKRRLDIDKLLQIAIAFDMDIVELITYSEKDRIKKSEPIKAILQIELQQEKKDQVLKLIFGQNNLEILNK